MATANNASRLAFLTGVPVGLCTAHLTDAVKKTFEIRLYSPTVRHERTRMHTRTHWKHMETNTQIHDDKACGMLV